MESSMKFIFCHTMTEHWISILIYFYFLCAGLRQKMLVPSTAI